MVLWNRWLHNSDPNARWHILQSCYQADNHSITNSSLDNGIEWVARFRSLGARGRRPARLRSEARFQRHDISDESLGSPSSTFAWHGGWRSPHLRLTDRHVSLPLMHPATC